MSAPAFYVEELDAKGCTLAVMSGMGRNRGTWDSAARTLSTARRWLRTCRRDYPARRFAIGSR